ncbi:hypothetical protein NM208_g5788 [Fusarium decemcellulare]|uniref:Uncharacterized protein n=1 Tax=Fusarium decemcellulare TaxID=57161 RepID=A0ACC1SFI0_9HYPO|nr:hypothetical protein NM208_g5788 [Fusarium decemcellulare]
MEISMEPASMILTRVLIGKVKDLDQLRLALRRTPLQQETKCWNWVDWAEEAYREAIQDGKALGDCIADWETIRDTVMLYVETKKLAHRFDGRVAARKVKCDEAKPCCRRCVSTGRKCDGYAPQGPRTSSLRAINPNRVFHFAANQDLCRALEHYSHVAGPALSVAQDRYFWTHLVLQFTNFEPAVRHSVVAISLLYQHLDPLQSGRETTAQEQYAALVHYNAAIRELKVMNTSEKQPVVLLVCLLFVCIEMLQQDRQRAVQHCKHGFAMLANCSASKYRWAQQFLEPVFRRLAVFPFFFGTGDADYPDLSQLSDSSRDSFGSFSDARYMLDNIFSQALRLYCIGDEYRIGLLRNCLVPQELLRDQIAINHLLDTWESLFATFADQESTPPSAETSKEPNLLLSRQFLLARSYVCRIAANMAFDQEETGYDKYIGLFQRVRQNLDSIAACVSPNVPKRTSIDTSRTKFTFEMGFMPTICFCILKCRHLETRLRFWRLLPILSKSQESLWQLNAMITADRRLIEIEHGIYLNAMQEDTSLYQSKLPAEGMRMRRMRVDSVPTHRVINGRHVTGRMVGFTGLAKNGDISNRTEFVPEHPLQ